jgi:hypothetical protein
MAIDRRGRAIWQRDGEFNLHAAEWRQVGLVACIDARAPSEPHVDVFGGQRCSGGRCESSSLVRRVRPEELGSRRAGQPAAARAFEGIASVSGGSISRWHTAQPGTIEQLHAAQSGTIDQLHTAQPSTIEQLRDAHV